jgi:NAD(P)-dependent dehydrogenase (short-subunit alcohol dehydrogenase family)
MGKSCEGLVALVTGASKGGTGTALAHRLAAEGAKVVITARSRKGLERTRGDIEAFGGQVLAIECDLADPEGGRQELVRQTADHFGPVDILVNNAAVGGYKPFEDWTMAELEQMQQVNAWAPWQLMQQVLPGMRERGRGWILNMTSYIGELPSGPPFANSLPVQLGSAYGATKACLNRLTLAAAAENQHTRVAINALTPQAAIVTPELVIARAAGHIDPDFFEPLETMVEAAMALCSPAPQQLNGRIAYSLQLLLELQRPVYDLQGSALEPGWQPADIPGHLEIQVKAHHRAGLNGEVYNFHRDSSPYV